MKNTIKNFFPKSLKINTLIDLNEHVADSIYCNSYFCEKKESNCDLSTVSTIHSPREFDYYHTPLNTNFSFFSNNNLNVTSEQRYKTELCRTWVENNFCPYNDKCRFAHGRKELNEKTGTTNKYKLKNCKSFYSKGICPYGPRCQFRHDERKLNNISLSFYSLSLEKKKDEILKGFNDEKLDLEKGLKDVDKSFFVKKNNFNDIDKFSNNNVNINYLKTLPVFRTLRFRKQFSYEKSIWNKTIRKEQILTF